MTGRMRGLMLDAARLPERPGYYRRFLDFCAQWDVNTVVFRLTDDQGCAMRFERHPELVTHQHALEKRELAGLVAHAVDLGIEMIPEVESFGHCRYITGADRHAGLSDKAEGDTDWREGLIPLHPEVLGLLGDLYEEVAEVFPGRYLHGGCDEVTWGASRFSAKLLESSTRAQVWAEYLNALNSRARLLGKEFIVWADMVLRRDPECLEGLDRGVILHDWIYKEHDPAALRAVASRATEMGFRVIGGPALVWARWGPRIGREQLRNVDAFAEAYGEAEDQKVLGLITTNWIPGRFLPGADLDAQAYAAVAMSEGPAAARAGAFERFTERHFGSGWNETWADVFHTLYSLALPRSSNVAHWMGPFLEVPWHDRGSLADVTGRRPGYLHPYGRLLSQFDELADSVKANRRDFEALRLSAKYLGHLEWRDRAVGVAAEEGPVALRRAVAEVAARDDALLGEVRSAWDLCRPPVSLEPGEGGRPSADHLLGALAAAAAFSRRFSEEPGTPGGPAGRGTGEGQASA